MTSIRLTGEIQFTAYGRQLFYLDPRRRQLKLANREISLSKKRTGNLLQFKLNEENLEDIPDVRDYAKRRGILDHGEITVGDILSLLVSDLNYKSS